MTTTEYIVRAETHEGKIVRLRGGFQSRVAAEDHPVTLKLWKRVWIDEVQVETSKPPALPPFPWSWVASGRPDGRGQFHAYLTDATGRKIAAIWGREGEKKLIADHIVDTVNNAPAALWVCSGCGTTKTLEQIKGEHPDAISCCPERKMVPRDGQSNDHKRW